MVDAWDGEDRRAASECPPYRPHFLHRSWNMYTTTDPGDLPAEEIKRALCQRVDELSADSIRQGTKWTDLKVDVMIRPADGL